MNSLTLSITSHKLDIIGHDLLLLCLAEFDLLEKQSPHVVTEAVCAQCTLEVIFGLDSSS